MVSANHTSSNWTQTDKKKVCFPSEKLSCRFTILFFCFLTKEDIFFVMQLKTVCRFFNMFKKTCIFRRLWRGRLPLIRLVCRTRFQRGTRDSTVDWIESLSRKEHHLVRQGGQLKILQNLIEMKERWKCSLCLDWTFYVGIKGGFGDFLSSYPDLNYKSFFLRGSIYPIRQLDYWIWIGSKRIG